MLKKTLGVQILVTQVVALFHRMYSEHAGNM